MNPQSQKHVVVLQIPKNAGVAAVLGLFLGPVGLLYAGRLLPAIIMFFVSGIIGLFTFGFGLAFIFPICAIWAYSAANSFNKELLTKNS